MGKLTNPRFKTEGDAGAASAAGWEFFDNCDEALSSPACDTEPFPEPDGVISGRLGASGKYDLGVNDFSDQSFTPVEGTYVRTVRNKDALLVEADTTPVRTRVRLRHDENGDDGIYTAVLFVLLLSTNEEVILEEIEITPGMDETINRTVEVAAYLGREIKIGWRLERVQDYVSVPLTMGAPNGYWRLQDGSGFGSTGDNEGTTGPGNQASILADCVWLPTGNPHGGVALHVPAPGGDAGIGAGLSDAGGGVRTRSFWIRPDVSSAGGTVAWWFYHITGATLGYITMGAAVDGKRDLSLFYQWDSFRTSTGSAVAALNDDEWNNIFVVVRTATGTIDLYVNGVLVLSATTGQAEVVSGANTGHNLGVRWNGTDEPNSDFWEVAAWTAVGTAEDAFEVYYRGLNNIRLDALE